jgi:predicted nucleic-acid-binding Zn-ribbon protein
MNNRIQKLAEQADEYADTKLQMPGEYHPDWHDVRDEKFAQLIVKECGIALNPMLRDMISRGQAYDLIKKHFGVE